MYSKPQIESVGSASELIQGHQGSNGESGTSGFTKSMSVQTELEME